MTRPCTLLLAALAALALPAAAAASAQPAETPRAGALGRTVHDDVGVAPGQVLVVLSRHRLYLGMGDGRARMYPVAVGKRGARWHGTAVVGRMVDHPTWHPTAHQRRVRRLPSSVAPGPHNPLGVRAIYLFRGGRDTLYRIHGTNEPGSIGHSVSSGCIRMRNADVIDLFRRVRVGTRVTVR